MINAEYFAPREILGIHEPGGEYLITSTSHNGWILFIHSLGHDPSTVYTMDYTPWVDKGLGIIARLNHGYGSDGTIPTEEHYEAFAETVKEHVRKSKGCGVFIIGNEMNHKLERPNGQVIYPNMYASCFAKCYKRIHALPGSRNIQVVLGPVGPYNNDTKYAGNLSGDWIAYWTDTMKILHDAHRIDPDALALHAYTHGSEARLIFSVDEMDSPFTDRYYHFRTYIDSMNAIPSWMRHVPVYITETNQYDAWNNANDAWVQTACTEIGNWNDKPYNQQIRSLILYRWPKYDKWAIEGCTKLYSDIQYAARLGRVWHPRDTDPKPIAEDIFVCPHCGTKMKVVEVGDET